VIRLLGSGGMGAVYHAWDDELGVALALKVIRPEVTADPESARDVERRFKRELLLAPIPTACTVEQLNREGSSIVRGADTKQHKTI
jgi:serine/threonine protein kinase